MPRDKKLKELAQLAQITGALEQPGLDRQQLADRANAQRVQSALGILGLTQGATESEARLGLEREKLAADKAQNAAMNEAYRLRNFNDAGQTLAQPMLDPAVRRAYEATYPQFAQARTDVNREEQEAQVKRFLPQIKALEGNTKALATLRAAIPPDVLNEIDRRTALPPGVFDVNPSPEDIAKYGPTPSPQAEQIQKMREAMAKSFGGVAPDRMPNPSPDSAPSRRSMIIGHAPKTPTPSATPTQGTNIIPGLAPVFPQDRNGISLLDWLNELMGGPKAVPRSPRPRPRPGMGDRLRLDQLLNLSQ